jgi:hypothetical protein
MALALSAICNHVALMGALTGDDAQTKANPSFGISFSTVSGSVASMHQLQEHLHS